jgi:hypothetical protein
MLSLSLSIPPPPPPPPLHPSSHVIHHCCCLSSIPCCPIHDPPHRQWLIRGGCRWCIVVVVVVSLLFTVPPTCCLSPVVVCPLLSFVPYCHLSSLSLSAVVPICHHCHACLHLCIPQSILQAVAHRAGGGCFVVGASIDMAGPASLIHCLSSIHHPCHSTCELPHRQWAVGLGVGRGSFGVAVLSWGSLQYEMNLRIQLRMVN